MAQMKHPENYTTNEVAMWLVAIGLGSKAENFKEAGVDGSMLLILGNEDFEELGLSGLQGKKLLNSLEFSKSLGEAAETNGGDHNSAEMERELQKLRDENAALRWQLKEVYQHRARSGMLPQPPASPKSVTTPPTPEQQLLPPAVPASAATQPTQQPTTQPPQQPPEQQKKSSSGGGGASGAVGGVVASTAGGAVKGTVQGAVVGAMMGNAGKGAAVGAAAGATGGAMSGVGGLMGRRMRRGKR